VVAAVLFKVPVLPRVEMGEAELAIILQMVAPERQIPAAVVVVQGILMMEHFILEALADQEL
jgi:hypothetical protein